MYVSMLLLSRLESTWAMFSLRIRPSGVYIEFIENSQELLIDALVVTFGIYAGDFRSYFIENIQEVLIDALVVTVGICGGDFLP